MDISLFTHEIKVFVADVSNDMSETKNKLCIILGKAGIKVFNSSGNEDTDIQLMQQSNCSIHLLGNVDIYDPQGKGFNSNAGKQYRLAKNLRSKTFKMFVWNPSGQITDNNKYINNIRREIVENTIYSSKTSAIVFVEELRTIMNIRTEVQQEIQHKDIFFIYNDLDKQTAEEISHMLEDIQTVTTLGISMNSNIDYTEYIKNQLSGCKIGVIYYNYAGDWAVSFARQVWKDNGGQSGKTPIFLVGNSAHANEEELKIFDGIIETIIHEISLLPLDIKVFFDKTTAKTAL